jgi:UDP:flavonoid glycosyltransferase YjiC (YdhE family)
MFQDESGNYRLKVAFDYDETLTDPLFFKLAKRLIAKGHDVWILTVRTSDEQYKAHCVEFNLPISDAPRNQDLKDVAIELGIVDKIIYTDADDKLEFFQEHQFDLLFDDDADWHCNPICEKGGIAIHI